MRLPKDFKSTIINLMVITASLVLVMAILFAVPATRAAILGTLSSAAVRALNPEDTAVMTQSTFESMDPEAAAQIINDDETRTVLIQLLEETLVAVEPDAAAELMNSALADDHTTDFLHQLLPMVNPDAMSQLVNTLLSDPAFINLVTDTVSHLDAQAMSDLVGDLVRAEDTESQPWFVQLISSVVGGLDASTMSNLVNQLLDDEAVTDFLEALLPQIINNIDVASIANDLLASDELAALISDMLPELDTTAIGDFVNDIVTKESVVELINGLLSTQNPSALDPAAVANLINKVEGMGTFLNELIPELDHENMAGVVNGLLDALMVEDPETSKSWINDFMDTLDSAKLGALISDLEGVGDFVEDLVLGLNSEKIADIVNGLLLTLAEKDAEWVDEFMDNLDGKTVASLINDLDELSGFVTELVPKLEVQIVADLVNDLLAAEDITTTTEELLGALDVDKLAAFVNKLGNLGDFLGSLVPELDANKMAVVVDDLLEVLTEEDPDTGQCWIEDLLFALDPDKIAETTNALLAGLTVEDEYGDAWVVSLLEDLDAAKVSALVDRLDMEGIGDFLTDLIAEVDVAPIGDLINHLLTVDGLETFLTELVGAIDGATLANQLLFPILGDDATIGLISSIIDALDADGSLGDLLNGLDPVLAETLYPDLWMHIILEWGWVQSILGGIPIPEQDVWVQIDCLYAGPPSERPAVWGGEVVR